MGHHGQKAKTDARDARALCEALECFEPGNHPALALVRVPNEAEEQQRSLSRQRTTFLTQWRIKPFLKSPAHLQQPVHSICIFPSSCYLTTRSNHPSPAHDTGILKTRRPAHSPASQRILTCPQGSRKIGASSPGSRKFSYPQIFLPLFQSPIPTGINGDSYPPAQTLVPQRSTPKKATMKTKNKSLPIAFEASRRPAIRFGLGKRADLRL